MLALAERARGRRLRLRDARAATSTTTSRRSTGYGRLSGNTLDELRAGHRGDVEPDKRDPADFALWKAAGDGPAPQVADAALGRGLPGLAPRVLGDGDALPRRPRFDIHTGGIDNVFPHHEDEIAQSAPIVGDVPARHWVHGEFLLMDGQEDGQVGRQLPARHRAGRPRHRPAGVPIPAADLALRAQARVLGSVARRGRRPRSSRFGPVCARSGAPPPNGPWAAPPVLVAGAAGDRPEGIAPGVAGHGGDASGYVVTDRAHDTVRSPVPRRPRVPRSVRRGDRRRPGHAGRPRAAARDPALDDRRRTSAAGSSSMPMRSSVSISIASGRRRPPRRPCPTRSSPSSPTATRPGRRATIQRADGLRARIDALGWDVIDTPGGSEVRPRA